MEQSITKRKRSWRSNGMRCVTNTRMSSSTIAAASLVDVVGTPNTPSRTLRTAGSGGEGDVGEGSCAARRRLTGLPSLRLRANFFPPSSSSCASLGGETTGRRCVSSEKRRWGMIESTIWRRLGMSVPWRVPVRCGVMGGLGTQLVGASGEATAGVVSVVGETLGGRCARGESSSDSSGSLICASIIDVRLDEKPLPGPLSGESLRSRRKTSSPLPERMRGMSKRSVSIVTRLIGRCLRLTAVSFAGAEFSTVVTLSVGAGDSASSRSGLPSTSGTSSRSGLPSMSGTSSIEGDSCCDPRRTASATDDDTVVVGDESIDTMLVELISVTTFGALASGSVYSPAGLAAGCSLWVASASMLLLPGRVSSASLLLLLSLPSRSLLRSKYRSDGIELANAGPVVARLRGLETSDVLCGSLPSAGRTLRLAYLLLARDARRPARRANVGEAGPLPLALPAPLPPLSSLSSAIPIRLACEPRVGDRRVDTRPNAATAAPLPVGLLCDGKTTCCITGDVCAACSGGNSALVD
eukprot:Unigene7744_Nuclearia_a/m.23775 Unigene7744_Nuclearia_a/g.23775  ORF Unigene7744_Nuclearia_a/g.23775 Unigene7744_Nuclearia_a/m.23775 type:complete len:525 (-) Unigene7744_Nuclearia_a:621-2195(-)